jgi:hypothetical protein
MYKIIGADGREYGPINADQLRQWIAEGRANAQSQILAEGATEWKPLSEFPEFNVAAASAPPAFAAAPTVIVADATQVNGPAIGLIIVGILEVLGNAVGLICNLIGYSFLTATQGQNQALANMMSGTVGVVTSIIGMLLAGLVVFGAFKMKNLENYGLAMTASIVAMLPCSLCCVVGLPIGIWSLVVLSKPEVKSVFH